MTGWKQGGEFKRWRLIVGPALFVIVAAVMLHRLWYGQSKIVSD